MLARADQACEVVLIIYELHQTLRPIWYKLHLWHHSPLRGGTARPFFASHGLCQHALLARLTRRSIPPFEHVDKPALNPPVVYPNDVINLSTNPQLLRSLLPGSQYALVSLVLL